MASKRNKSAPTPSNQYSPHSLHLHVNDPQYPAYLLASIFTRHVVVQGEHLPDLDQRSLSNPIIRQLIPLLSDYLQFHSAGKALYAPFDTIPLGDRPLTVINALKAQAVSHTLQATPLFPESLQPDEDENKQQHEQLVTTSDAISREGDRSSHPIQEDDVQCDVEQDITSQSDNALDDHAQDENAEDQPYASTWPPDDSLIRIQAGQPVSCRFLPCSNDTNSSEQQISLLLRDTPLFLAKPHARVGSYFKYSLEIEQDMQIIAQQSPQMICLTSPTHGLLLLPRAFFNQKNRIYDQTTMLFMFLFNTIASLQHYPTLPIPMMTPKQKSSTQKSSVSNDGNSSSRVFPSSCTFPLYKSSLNRAIPSITALIIDAEGQFGISLWHRHFCLFHHTFTNNTTITISNKQKRFNHVSNSSKKQAQGSHIRRQYSDQLKHDIHQCLYQLRFELASCSQILVHVPDQHTYDCLFMTLEQVLKWQRSCGIWIGYNSAPINQHDDVLNSITILEKYIMNKTSGSSAMTTSPITAEPEDDVDSSPNKNAEDNDNDDSITHKNITIRNNNTNEDESYVIVEINEEVHAQKQSSLGAKITFSDQCDDVSNQPNNAQCIDAFFTLYAFFRQAKHFPENSYDMMSSYTSGLRSELFGLPPSVRGDQGQQQQQQTSSFSKMRVRSAFIPNYSACLEQLWPNAFTVTSPEAYIQQLRQKSSKHEQSSMPVNYPKICRGVLQQVVKNTSSNDPDDEHSAGTHQGPYVHTLASVLATRSKVFQPTFSETMIQAKSTLQRILQHTPALIEAANQQIVDQVSSSNYKKKKVKTNTSNLFSPPHPSRKIPSTKVIVDDFIQEFAGKSLSSEIQKLLETPIYPGTSTYYPDNVPHMYVDEFSHLYHYNLDWMEGPSIIMPPLFPVASAFSCADLPSCIEPKSSLSQQHENNEANVSESPLPHSDATLHRTMATILSDSKAFHASHYTIAPHHPATKSASICDQYTYLLHPHDPRIASFGQNIRNATHSDVILAYSKLMTTDSIAIKDEQ